MDYNQRLSIPDSVKTALRNLWSEVKIAKISRNSARHFQMLKDKNDLKVHLGCGIDVRSGWLNIDLSLHSTKPVAHYDSRTMFINHDLRQGLPLRAGSCALIYSSHFFEHLHYNHGLQLIHACYAALRPGGVFRLSIPDYRRAFEAYLQNDSDYFSLIDNTWLGDEYKPNIATIVDYINYFTYQHGEHKYIYDKDKLTTILSKMGFSSVISSTYKSDIDPNPPVRQRYSLYIEAVK